MPFEETIIGVAPPAQQPEKSSEQQALEAAHEMIKKDETGVYTSEMLKALRQEADLPPIEKPQPADRVDEVRADIAQQAAPRSQEPFVASSEDVKTNYDFSLKDLQKGNKPPGFWSKIKKSIFG
ncbi:MAG: hypothetical protein WC750_00320 [Patescibacteria group bacterium]|jgi:hypothetical protein